MFGRSVGCGSKEGPLEGGCGCLINGHLAERKQVIDDMGKLKSSC